MRNLAGGQRCREGAALKLELSLEISAEEQGVRLT